MNQKLSDWASMAEIASAIAVVITLILVLVELRENTEAVRAAARQSIAARIEDRTMGVAADSQLADLIFRGQEPGGIEPGSRDEYQLSYFYTSVATSLEEAYFQFQEGNLDAKFFEPRARRGLYALSTPAARDWLERRQLDYAPDFIAWAYSQLDR